MITENNYKTIQVINLDGKDIDISVNYKLIEEELEYGQHGYVDISNVQYEGIDIYPFLKKAGIISKLENEIYENEH